MRPLWLALCLVTLAGCKSWWGGDKPAQANPAPEAQEQTTQQLGDKLDRADHLVAASVAVAREANAQGKPPVVEAELAVAASLLPPAPKGDLAEAQLRAQKSDPKAYEQARAEGAKLKSDLDALWQKMEAQQKKSAQEIADLKKQLNDRDAALEAERKAKASQQLTTLGVGLIAAGVGLLAFGHFIGVSKLSALLVILGGVLCTSLTWLLDSPAFKWVSIGIAALIGLAGLQGLVAVSLKTWRWAFPAKPAEPIEQPAPEQPQEGEQPK
jgi:hypothetical protein